MPRQINTPMSEGELRSPLGLVAGNGLLPMLFAESAKAKGFKVVAVAHTGEANPQLAALADSCTWVRVGQLGRIIKEFRRAGVAQAAFAGGIHRAGLLRSFRPDLRAIRSLAKLRAWKDDGVLRAVAGEFERDGIAVFSASLLLQECIARSGRLTRRDPGPEELRNARLAFEAAKALGAVDIGQTVVACRGVIVAVEAIEGTDAALRRAGELIRAGRAGNASSPPAGTVVKVCKPGQDKRFDLPTIGPGTIDTMREAGLSCLIVESNNALILEAQKVSERAEAAGIAIRIAGSAAEL